MYFIGGKLVVSMRPYKPEAVSAISEITGRFPGAHGAPIHIGSPQDIGIACLSDPDFGDAVRVEEDELPVFWACGVTPQTALEEAKLPLAITHSPGMMFVSDVLDQELMTR